MSRVAVYVRISKDREGTEYGIERQEKLCRETLIGPDDTVTIYPDNDLSASESARKPRPQFDQMVADVQAGRIDKIASYTLKRLTRRYDEGGVLLALAKDHGVAYAFVRSAPVDLNSAAGRKQFRAMINDAISESDETGERIRDKFDQKRAAGEHHGGALFGYTWRNKQPRINRKAAAAIRRDAEYVLAGGSLSEVARRWTADGFKPPRAKKWGPVQVRGVLLRPTTAGILVHKGVEMGRGSWKPILDEATWRRLCTLLQDPERQLHNGTTPRWIGSSLYGCGKCTDGTTMRSASQQTQSYRDDGTRVRRTIYRCRNYNHLLISAEPVDAFVRATIAGILRARGADLLVRGDSGVDLATLDRELADLRARREASAAAYAEEKVSLEGWTKADSLLGKKIDKVQAQLAQAAPVASPLTGVADAPDPGAVFLALDVEQQRLVVRAIATVTIRPHAGGARRAGEIDYDRVVIAPK